MEAYTSFARVYDTFMDNVPYDEWKEFLLSILHEEGIEEGILLDLGCGTGSMTQCLAKEGFDMIGIDASEEMLEIANEKKENFTSENEILYLLQDMTEFELYGTVKAIVSCCDCVNYITEKEELLKVFQLANNYLDPKGLFIFDFNTKYKYEEMLGDQVIAENREDASFIWDNYYYEDEEMNEYELTLFIREEQNSGDSTGYEDQLFHRYQETHYQKAYTLEDMKELIEASGMEFVAAFDGYQKEEAHPFSERVVVVARECGK